MYNLIYNLSIAYRIYQKAVREVRKFHNCVLVIFKKGHGSPRFTSFKDFKREFANARRLASRDYYVRNAGSHFQVFKHDGNRYKVRQPDSHFECNCDDHFKQKQAGISTPTCKHVFAVLRDQGFNSLSEWKRHKQQQIFERNLEKQAAETIIKFIPELDKLVTEYGCDLVKKDTDVFSNVWMRLYDGGSIVAEIKAGQTVTVYRKHPRKEEYTAQDLRSAVIELAKQHQQVREKEEKQAEEARNFVLQFA